MHRRTDNCAVFNQSSGFNYVFIFHP